MQKLKIKDPSDIFILSDSNNSLIKNGCTVYCGQCGETVGKVSYEIKYPVNGINFIKSLKNSSILPTTEGVKHKRCGKVLFVESKQIRFIDMGLFLGKSIPYYKERAEK